MAAPVDLPDGARAKHLRVECMDANWTRVIGLDKGPLLAKVREWEGDNRGAYLKAKAKPGKAMEIRVNIEKGNVNYPLTVQLPPPEDQEWDLPSVDIRLDRLSHTYTVPGKFRPNLRYSKSGKTVRLYQSEYSGTFNHQVRMTGRIPFGNHGDQMDASHLTSHGGYPLWHVRGHCEYKIRY